MVAFSLIPILTVLAIHFIYHPSSTPAPIVVSFGAIEYSFVENEGSGFGTIQVITSRPSSTDFSFTVTARTLS